MSFYVHGMTLTMRRARAHTTRAETQAVSGRLRNADCCLDVIDATLATDGILETLDTVASRNSHTNLFSKRLNEEAEEKLPSAGAASWYVAIIGFSQVCVCLVARIEGRYAASKIVSFMRTSCVRLPAECTKVLLFLQTSSNDGPSIRLP